MQGTDVAERKWACVAVSNLIQNDPSTRRLLQGKNVVGALITRLTDSEEEVAIEALGALRYVSRDALGCGHKNLPIYQKSLHRRRIRHLRGDVQ
jgi:hypothetical protein